MEKLKRKLEMNIPVFREGDMPGSCSEGKATKIERAVDPKAVPGLGVLTLTFSGLVPSVSAWTPLSLSFIICEMDMPIASF